jgi:hypothetical protein
MLQQQVTSLPGPDLDESRRLQLADHLGPSHFEIVNLPIGLVNACAGLESTRVRFLSAVLAATDGKLLKALDEESGEPKFRQLEPDPRMVAPATRSPGGVLTSRLLDDVAHLFLEASS